jgi:hypothetical protein
MGGTSNSRAEKDKKALVFITFLRPRHLDFKSGQA